MIRLFDNLNLWTNDITYHQAKLPTRPVSLQGVPQWPSWHASKARVRGNPGLCFWSRQRLQFDCFVSLQHGFPIFVPRFLLQFYSRSHSLWDNSRVWHLTGTQTVSLCAKLTTSLLPYCGEKQGKMAQFSVGPRCPTISFSCLPSIFLFVH